MGIRFRHRCFDLLLWVALSIASSGVACPQGQKPDAQKVEESLNRVQQWRLNPGDLALVDVQRLAQAGETRAIAALKEEFPVTKDAQLKLAIASALVRLGEKDQMYWDLLADGARKAVECDAPSIFMLDSEGKVDRNQRELPPEFIAWAKAHNLDPATAAQQQVYELPGRFLYLAITGDSRGRELLRMGLKSHNTSIRVYAAKGLAKLQDKESIPLIIEVYGMVSRERASMIARAPLFF